MRTLQKVLCMVVVFCAASLVSAAPASGCWNTVDGDFEAGTWQELFAGGGEGQPGNIISASNSTWSLDGAMLESHEWISQTPTVHMHKTTYVGGTVMLDAGGPWETAGDTLPYEIALGDLVVYTTKTFDPNGVLTELIWTIESEGTLVGCDSYKIRITAGYVGMPTPVMAGDVVGMTDAIDAVEICISVEGIFRVFPRTLNLGSRGNWVTSFLRLGDCIDMADVDPNSILLNETLAPAWSRVFTMPSGAQILMMKFDRSDLEEILEPGTVELILTGSLANGTEFSASDTIRVIERPRPRPHPEHSKPSKSKGK